MKIYLFDMDDTLLTSGGYHRALQDLVALLGGALGFRGLYLSEEAIAAFEAAGITSEWDESAICLALMMEKLWLELDPVIPVPRLEQIAAYRRNPERFPPHQVAPPDFHAFALAVERASRKHLPPLERLELMFLQVTRLKDPLQIERLLQILRTARDFDQALTYRIFQEFTLGSHEFEEFYGLESLFDTPSYLFKYDIPNLAAPELAVLTRWLGRPDHRAAIMTNRPNESPEGRLTTPEAEIGAQAVGLAHLPIAGYGGIFWLGRRYQIDPETLLKPSGVHALAALRLALGDDPVKAFEAAADLALNRNGGRNWMALQGAEVAVFEDSWVGFASARHAHQLLQEQGIEFTLRYYGVTGHDVKRRALRDAGGEVFTDLPDALRAAGIDWRT